MNEIAKQVAGIPWDKLFTNLSVIGHKISVNVWDMAIREVIFKGVHQFILFLVCLVVVLFTGTLLKRAIAGKYQANFEAIDGEETGFCKIAFFMGLGSAFFLTLFAGLIPNFTECLHYLINPKYQALIAISDLVLKR